MLTRASLRAARALEALACEQLLPSASNVEFNPYKTDPGRKVPCQNCHVRIDGAVLDFKRFAKQGVADASRLKPACGRMLQRNKSDAIHQDHARGAQGVAMGSPVAVE